MIKKILFAVNRMFRHPSAFFSKKIARQQLKLAVEDYYKSMSQQQRAEWVKQWYSKNTGRELNLISPETFEDKINYLKLYKMTPLHKRLVDKYMVRDWIKEKIGEKYLIPLLGVWKSFEEIDFSSLPDSFVLKCNHGSGWNIIVKNKSELDLKNCREKLNFWMSKNYAFSNGFELQYDGVPPRIIAEKYLPALNGNLFDYRFYCFNGKPQYIWLDVKSGTPEHKRNIYSLDWKLLPMQVMWPPIEETIPPPESLQEMLICAEKLCSGFDFVRVDFYEIDGKPLFGEMTFVPMSGIGMPEKENIEFGELLQIQATLKETLF